MKLLTFDKEYDCPFYSEEDDLSMGVMLKCSKGAKTRWEKGCIRYDIPEDCPLLDATEEMIGLEEGRRK